MKNIPILFTFFSLVLVACSGAVVPPTPPPDQPSHPLLEGLKPPPLNQPITATGIPGEPVQIQLPEDGRPVLYLVQDERAFTGDYQASGRLLVSSSVIEITSDDKPPLQILYRAPGEMNELPEGTMQGEVSIVELSGPEGANRQVIVRDEKGLIFAEVWRTSEKPLSIDTGNDLQFAQEAVQPEASISYTEANLVALSENEPIASIPIGETVTLETQNGVFQVFVEVSHLFVPSSTDQDQYPMVYILHLWLIRQ